MIFKICDLAVNKISKSIAVAMVCRDFVNRWIADFKKGSNSDARKILLFYYLVQSIIQNGIMIYSYNEP